MKRVADLLPAGSQTARTDATVAEPQELIVSMPTRFLALIVSVVSAIPAVAKETPALIDVMTCTRSDGTTARENVFAYSIGASTPAPLLFTIYVSGHRFVTWFEAQYFAPAFDTCSFAGIPGITLDKANVVDVAISGVGANVDAGTLSEDGINQRYTELTFIYNGISTAAGVMPTAAAVSPEAQAKAVAAFKARGLGIPRR